MESILNFISLIFSVTFTFIVLSPASILVFGLVNLLLYKVNKSKLTVAILIAVVILMCLSEIGQRIMFTEGRQGLDVPLVILAFGTYILAIMLTFLNIVLLLFKKLALRNGIHNASPNIN